MKTKILVTGAAGFIGSELCKELIKNNDFHVIGIDNLLTGKRSNLPASENFNFIKCDVNKYNDIQPVMSLFRFDYIFHYAAVVGVNRTITNPIMVLEDIVGIQNLLNLSKNTCVRKIFFSSSSEVYGEPVETPQNELTTPLNARLPYAVVKNLGEVFLKAFNHEHGLNYTIFRFFNTYGPAQSEDFVISKFLRAALQGQPLTIYGDGSQTRTFCYVKDNVDTVVSCLSDSASVGQTINIGSDDEISILQLAETIISITNSSSDIKFLPPLTEGDMTRRKPDIATMKKILGRKPISLTEGIRRMVSDNRWKS